VPACDHFGQELTGGKDDRVFRLDRVKDACCRNEAVLKAIIIGITLMLSAAATRPSCCDPNRGRAAPAAPARGGGSVTAVVGERAGGEAPFHRNKPRFGTLLGHCGQPSLKLLSYFAP
jgi:hypothetical protein